MGVNFHFLLEKMDVMHALLCKSQRGTWQDRAAQVVEAVQAADAARHRHSLTTIEKLQEVDCELLSEEAQLKGELARELARDLRPEYRRCRENLANARTILRLIGVRIAEHSRKTQQR